MKVLITSALPYINGIKHLGNLAGSLLPADIHARYRRQCGDEVLFICATDEHGTPAELAAAEAGLDVATYCAQQHAIHADIYRRLDLSFDHFGRSSSPANHALTQHFYQRLAAHGLIEERSLLQLWSQADGRFLADRYVCGTCPHCGHTASRGDQCEACTRTLDAIDLIEPRSALSGSAALEPMPTRHLFLRQSALVPRLERWLASRRDWPPLVTSIARKWLDEGIRDRCITRDLAWGVPVPAPGWENKVFYVWFDAPIAYIAATQDWAAADPQRRDWRGWWQADDVRYLQFLGKDNVPFHAVSFPCTLLGSGEPWKTVDVIRGVNWLTYAGGKFSTSARRGVFLDQALALLPADCWRWWLAANAPENHDTDFTFARFAAEVTHDLADGFGNLASRTLALTANRFGGIVPRRGTPGSAEATLTAQLQERLEALQAAHDALSLRKASASVRAIWRLGNQYLAAQEPWTVVRYDPVRAGVALRTALNLLHVAACAAWPFIPRAASQVLSALGDRRPIPPLPGDAAAALAALAEGSAVTGIGPLFTKLDAAWIAAQTDRFSGEGLRHSAQAP